MGFGKQVVTDIGVFANYFVKVPQLAYSIVTFPTICMDNATWLYMTSNYILQAFARSIWHSLKTNSSNPPAILLGSNYNKLFAGCATAAFPGFFSTNKSLIYLDSATEAITTWTHHSAAQFMKPCPSGSVTAKSKNSLQPQGIRAILLVCNMPDRIKPKLQRLFAILKNCTSKKRGLNSTTPTMVKAPVGKPSFMIPTAWTSKTIGPTQPKKILAAVFLGRKKLFQFEQIFGVILHNGRCYI